jgi:multidrug resistance efflux pump
MLDYKPIPTPLSQHWRLFRTRLLPVLVFTAAIGAMMWLWEQESTPGVMIGEVYAPSSMVSSPRGGWLEGGPIEMFREVRAGEKIGVIRTMPPEYSQLALAVLREEIEMIRLGVADPVLDQQRNLLSLHGLRRDWLLVRSDLAALRVQMRQAELDLTRLEELARQGYESSSAIEQARALYEAMVAEVKEKTSLAELLQTAVKEVDAQVEDRGPPDVGITAALDWKEAELRRLEAELAPVAIYAPFDGRLTKVFRHSGDFVNLGEPIAEIRSKHAESIIGYLKPPFPFRPEVGMAVDVIPRSIGGSEAVRARVLAVGPQFEALQPAFLRPMPVTLEERALPVLISLSDKVSLVPGEIVDIRLLKPGN